MIVILFVLVLWDVDDEVILEPVTEDTEEVVTCVAVVVVVIVFVFVLVVVVVIVVDGLSA